MADIEPTRMVATSVSLPEGLEAEAAGLGLDVSDICGAALAAEVARRRRALAWQQENAAAIEAYNAMVESEGLMLAGYSQL